MIKLRLLPGIFTCLTALLSAQTVYTVKMATVAPEGSLWMREFHKFDKDLSATTGGQVKFRVYPNAVQGGEKDILRKMQLGQLDIGTFTGVGLGELVHEVRILDLPFLFKNSAEVDYVYGKLFEEFQQKFIEKGFYLAGWAEVGLIYLLTRNPVSSPADFKDVKMWLWKGDPLARATFEELKISAIPLDITDVHTALQTGLIDGVYISPYGALALQWYTKTKYMLNYPLTNSVGAVLITQRKLNSLPADLREIFITKTKIYMRQIVLASRAENIESIKVLQDNGIVLTNPRDQQAVREFDLAGQRTRTKLTGSLYSAELLNRILQYLDEYRKQNAK